RFPPRPTGARGTATTMDGRTRRGRAPSSGNPDGLIPSFCSSPAAPWHPTLPAYRCCLPALTGFTSRRRTGPGSQHSPAFTVPAEVALGRAFSPAQADCGYRAPLVPHLARPAAIVATSEDGAIASARDQPRT